MIKKRKTSVRIPKYITSTARILEKISPKLALSFGLKIFYRPIRFARPERENKIYNTSEKGNIDVNGKSVRTYSWLNGEKKVMIIHGWSGRGTQLNKIIEYFIEKNYTVHSFDAPAHGESKGKTTHMFEFVDSIKAMENNFGKFDAIVGHSMGGVASLNAVYEGVIVSKVVVIGTPNLIMNVIYDFCMNINLSEKIVPLIQDYIENKYNKSVYSVSSEYVGARINVPILIVHDEDDKDVEFSEAVAINNKIENSELFRTKKLGHRLVLANKEVVEKVFAFVDA